MGNRLPPSISSIASRVATRLHTGTPDGGVAGPSARIGLETANMYLLRSIHACSIAVLQLVIPSQALNMGFPIQKPKAVQKVCGFLHFFSSNNLRCTPKVGSDAHPPWMRIWFKFWGTPQIITPSKPQKTAHIKGGPCNSLSCWESVLKKKNLNFSQRIKNTTVQCTSPHHHAIQLL